MGTMNAIPGAAWEFEGAATGAAPVGEVSLRPLPGSLA